MSIMVGTGRGARAGVLIKNAEALEVLEKVDTLVVDKTGTLTEGRPKLVAVVAEGSFDEQRLLGLVASLELASEHPLATSIVTGARERGITLTAAKTFESVTGMGVKGNVDGQEIMLGNARLLAQHGVGIAPLLQQRAEELRSGGPLSCSWALTPSSPV